MSKEKSEREGGRNNLVGGLDVLLCKKWKVGRSMRKYVLEKWIKEISGELYEDLRGGYMDEGKGEYIGREFKVKDLKNGELEIWEKKGRGWVYVVTIKRERE